MFAMRANLVIGSGAAGLAAAVRLKTLGQDVVVCTEGLGFGTSVNSGSDKQTYYKLSLDGAAPDSPLDMAREMAAGGAMHGDIALVEASLSAIAFSHLAALGVAFPHDRFGRFAGYRTDHDARGRATSAGPYTSRDMCRALLREARRLGVEFRENLAAVKLLVADGAAVGAIFARTDAPRPTFETVLAENTVFATGGPGGLYGRSVYPGNQSGAIGLALLEGAEARNLAEAQFGMASVAFRWNVSGSYMQVLPRVYSVGADGVERDFLDDFFGDRAAARNAVFLKGYQWPFSAGNARRSSLIDILVHIETVERGRRVFLDYRPDDGGLGPGLSTEAADYLRRSDATGPTPFARLAAMNPRAIDLYREHGIDLAREPLEIAVCAQHSNGGLAGDIWWRSTNIPNLFPVGEVNGSHGVTRPGGSALNAGQVGAWRAAECIAATTRRNPAFASGAATRAARAAESQLQADLAAAPSADWRALRATMQQRMDAHCGFSRSGDALAAAAAEARRDLARALASGLAGLDGRACAEALRTRHLLAASYAYLSAAHAAVGRSGSRGGSIALGAGGEAVSPRLGPEWRMLPERTAARGECATLRLENDPGCGAPIARIGYEPCRPVPEEPCWFESVWRDFTNKSIFD